MRNKCLFPKIFALLIILTIGKNMFGQISQGGIPYSFQNKTGVYIPTERMKLFDIDKMLSEDKINSGKDIPFRFGKVFEVGYNTDNSGTYQILENGDKLWMLKIQSENAYSLGLVFGKYKLPEGASLFVYSSDQKTVLGSFTSENNKNSGKLAIAQVPTNEIVIEYFEPADVEFKADLQISKVIHDYRNVFGSNTEKGALDGSSLPCTVNINCPEAENWQDEKHAVCRLQMDGSLCSGALINNTLNDGTPYFLTAQHCVNTQIVAEEVIFYFNYEALRCDQRVASDNQTLSGSDLIAVTDPGVLDFALLRMSKTPPKNYEPYIAGWNRSTKPAREVVGIHHPAGDMKKFTYDKDMPSTGTFYLYRSSSHWFVADFEVGTAQGGSSGSPMFDENHRIVGDLSGGPSNETCDGLSNLYQKFDLAWDFIDNKSQQLKYWLDPLNTGAMTTEGFYIYEADFDAQIAQVITPNSAIFCNSEGKLSPIVKIYNRGNSVMSTLTIKYQIDNSPEISYNWTGSLAVDNSAEVTLPETIVENGFHDFKVFVENPNGKPDQYNYNDTITYNNFEVDKSGALVTITISTDYSGNETTWDITDNSGKILYSGGPYPKGVISFDKQQLCLTDGGEFNLNIYDSAGDGMKANGFGFWILNYGYKMTEQGGDFADKKSFYFIAEGVEEINPELANSISIFPNPASNIIFVQSVDIRAYKVEISDITGKIYQESQIAGYSKELDISKLQTGLYIIKIYTEQGIYNEKILINK